MSLESSDEDGDGAIIVHHLPWRSSSKLYCILYMCTSNMLHKFLRTCTKIELNDFLRILDQRADEQRKKSKHHAAERKPRQEGLDAVGDPPSNAPKWAINKIWKKGIHSYMHISDLLFTAFYPFQIRSQKNMNSWIHMHLMMRATKILGTLKYIATVN